MAYSDKITITIVFFSFQNKMITEFDPINKPTTMKVIQIESVKILNDAISDRFVNFICLDDIKDFSYFEIETLIKNPVKVLPPRIESNSTLSERTYYINPSIYQITFYYLSTAMFGKLYGETSNPGFNIIYYHDDKSDLFRFRILSNEQYKSLIRRPKDFNPETMTYDFQTKVKPIKRFEKDPPSKLLYQFIIFLVKVECIQFLSMREDYEEGQTIYRNLKDVKFIDDNVINEIQAIITYAFRSNALLFYQPGISWSSVTLNNSSHGISIIDKNFIILFANGKRRIRQKNNILGKYCYKVTMGSDVVCKDCPFIKLLSDKKLSTFRDDRHELKIGDKAGNKYWLSESNRVIPLFNNTEHVGVSICRDINLNNSILTLAMDIHKSIQTEFDLPSLCKKIIHCFINEIGFNRIRIYFNLSSDKKKRADLVLFSLSGEHDQLEQGKIILHETMATEYNDIHESIYNGFNENKPNINSQDEHMYLYDYNLKLYDRSMFKKNPEVFTKIFKELDLKTHWIDVPIWDGDDLLGVIGLDFGIEHWKWHRFNQDSIHQLIQASNLLASAIKNMLNHNDELKFINLSNSILNHNESNDDFVAYIPSLIAQRFSCAAFLLKTEGSTANITNHTYWDNQVDQTILVNMQIPLDSLPPRFDHIIDYHHLTAEEQKKHNWCSFLNLNRYKRYSFMFLPLSNDTSKSKYALILARVGSNTIIPFTSDDNEVLNSIIQVMNSRITHIDSQKESTSLIETLATTDSKQAGHAIDIYTEKLEDYLKRYYPQSDLYYLEIYKNKLNLITQNSREPERIMEAAGILKSNKVIHHFRYPGPKGRDINRRFISPILDFTNYTALVYMPVMYKQDIMGMIIVTTIERNRFDDDFIFMLNASASVLGNIIGLIADYNQLVTNQRRFFHDISNPIKVMKEAFDFMIPDIIGIDIFARDLDISIINTKTKKKYDSELFIRQLKNVDVELNIIHFLAQNANIRNFLNSELVKGRINIAQMVSKVCQLLNIDLHINYPGLYLDWHNLEPATIMGSKELINIALFNIIQNAIKYSTRSEKHRHYRPVIITGYLHPTQDLYELSVKNHGLTVSKDEIGKVFDENFRGTNAITLNTPGEGFGLNSAKQFLDKHGFDVRFEADYENEETIVTVIFTRVIKEDQ